MNLWNQWKSAAGPWKPRRGWRHQAKKGSVDAAKLAAGGAIMAGVGAGVTKALQGSSSPELSGPNDWAFLDLSTSLIKLDEVGPSNPSSGPSTLQIVCGLVLTLVVLLVLTPLIKLILSFKQMCGCFGKSAGGTPTQCLTQRRIRP